MPAYWNSQIYVWGNGGHLEAYSLTNGMVSQSPTSESANPAIFPAPLPLFLPTEPATESYGRWKQTPTIPVALLFCARYSANDVSNLLYGSNLTSGRDTLGPAVKFVVPVVTNGKVYVGAQNEVDVFGLISGETQAVAPAFNPAAGSYNVGTQVVMSTSTPNASIYYTTDGTTAHQRLHSLYRCDHRNRNHHIQCHRHKSRATFRVRMQLRLIRFRTKPRRLIYRPRLELIVPPKLSSFRILRRPQRSTTRPTAAKPTHNSHAIHHTHFRYFNHHHHCDCIFTWLERQSRRNRDVYDQSERHHHQLRHGIFHADRYAIQRVHRPGR